MAANYKETLFKKGIKAIPNAIWVICASYALMVTTTVVALMIAHIDADKHINRYFDILLTERELEAKQLNSKLEARLKHLEEMAHHPAKKH